VKLEVLLLDDSLSLFWLLWDPLILPCWELLCCLSLFWEDPWEPWYPCEEEDDPCDPLKLDPEEGLLPEELLSCNSLWDPGDPV
jgi:hypothetical protein